MTRQLVTLLCCVGPVLSAMADTSVNGPVVSAGLFKNGMTVVTREYRLTGPGRHVSEPFEAAVHGTLWLESDVPVVARLESVTVEEPNTEPTAVSTLRPLYGRPVRLYLREAGEAPLEGQLIGDPHATPGGLSAEATSFGSGAPMYGIALADGRQRFVAADQVVGIESLEAVLTEPGIRTRKKDVLVLDAGDAAGPAVVRATYLTRGLSWTPSYRLDLGADGELAIAQSAVIRNDLVDLDGAELELISGYPSVEFEQVTSPFAPGFSWSQFLGQLAGRAAPAPALTNQILLSNNGDFLSPDLNVPGGFPVSPAAEADDLYYHTVGEHSLKRGDALLFQVASARTTFQPLVEWDVPPSTDTEPDRAAEVWDSIRFTNPFAFPMTTGPAMVVKEERFLGSRLSPWANPGEQTIVRVGKALSITVAAAETEVARTESRQLDRMYWKSEVEGRLHLLNRRAEPVDLVIRKPLEGALLDADAAPETQVGQAGPGQLNPSVRLTWSITLHPGESRELVYRYAYLSH